LLKKLLHLPHTRINCVTIIGKQLWRLHCFQVHCGRYVHGHAVAHHLAEPTHAMSLSLADLSVWCYPCEAYVHNEVLIPAKSAAHLSKFGETSLQ
uniref:UBP-type domain-containing protein n=1 Tax=Haemonchus placei TaxID=6290 RepID=A0A0N4WRW4_HAEPC